MRHVSSFLQKLKIVVKGKAENQEDQIKRRRESCNPLRKDNKTEACCHYSQHNILHTVHLTPDSLTFPYEQFMQFGKDI